MKISQNEIPSGRYIQNPEAVENEIDRQKIMLAIGLAIDCAEAGEGMRHLTSDTLYVEAGVGGWLVAFERTTNGAQATVHGGEYLVGLAPADEDRVLAMMDEMAN